MKQYLISEEELRDILKSIARTAVDETDPIIDDSIFALNLSKQPVEVIAEGKVDCYKYCEGRTKWLKIGNRYMEGSNPFYNPQDIIEDISKYKGKNIKIIVVKGDNK